MSGVTMRRKSLLTITIDPDVREWLVQKFCDTKRGVSGYINDLCRAEKESTEKENPVAIYGIFSNSGKCLYIGQTIHFKERIAQLLGKHAKFRGHSRVTVKVLDRATSIQEAGILERRHIKNFKKRGEAQENFLGGATIRRLSRLDLDADYCAQMEPSQQ
jgi:hypothetical protein